MTIVPILYSTIHAVDAVDVVVMVTLLLSMNETFKVFNQVCTHFMNETTSGQYNIYDIIQFHYLLPQAAILTFYKIATQIALTDTLTDKNQRRI